MSSTTQQWRGVAADDIEGDLTAEISARLAGRSRRLLREVLRPWRRALWWLMVVVIVENAARLSIPYLVKAVSYTHLTLPTICSV